ncbi:isochorismatase family protein [Candidatus Thiosymbion oneisti]|uniref:isochorismatase family protein n=1 Tax=Candidatus Thiosymbion oneisti TaxID=589554 RepID=UPI000A986272|nr:isochorismatase family protein [Candidatus Thiosymbion oneisti]
MYPDKTALLLIGYQNDYFAEQGVLHKAIEPALRFEQVLSNTLSLLKEVVSMPTLIVSTPIIFTSDYGELMNPVGVLKTIKEQGAFQHGTWGAETIPELQAFGERILEVPGKRGLNAFSDTELDVVLRRHRIENLVIAGVLTSICVDSTGRTAVEHGYKTIILSDCTFGRTDFEQGFYCEKVFPIYSQVMEHRQLLESMHIHYRETLKRIEEIETETQIQQRLFEELAATEKRYRELVENLRNIVFRCDEKGVLTFVSPAWQGLLGYPLSDSVGRPLMDFVYPKDRRGGWEELSDQASQGPHRIRMSHQKGHVRWFDLSMYADSTNGGVGLLYDITRQQENEQRLLEAMASIEAATQAKDHFMATMSHEIRTPMNAVIGMAELLSHTELNENQQGYLKTIRSSGRSLLRVIDDILDFSRIEAGKLVLETCPIDPRAVVREVRDLLAGKAEEQGLELVVRTASEVPEAVAGDPTRLRQVLINLVGNAIKFTPEGRITIDLKLVATQKDAHLLEFAVRDTGIGIPAERQAMLFQPFSQGDSSVAREFGGTGLGLAISARLVELMDGTLVVESTPEVGSTFRFTIRAPSCDQPPENTQEPATLKLDRELPERLPLKILLAEDDEDSREFLSEMLDGMGYPAEVAGDGVEAVEHVKKTHYDIVLMDLRMPNMDGYRATREILNIGKEDCPIIIAVTANVLPGEREKCLAAGMSDFIRKPVDIGGLQEKLAYWGENRVQP